jgi:hypothetical protein
MVQFPPDVQEMLDRGELWRAKQRVSGRISYRYIPDLYEQYGVILMRMGDLRQAGRFLFLSGAREPAYDEAIAIFRRVHAKRGWETIIGEFPAGMKDLRRDQLAPQLRDELEAMGMPATKGDRMWTVTSKPATFREGVVHDLWHGFLSLFK